MKTDGSVIIDTKILDGGMEKGFEAIKQEMNSVGVKAEKLGNQVALSFSNMDVSKPIANAVERIKTLEAQFASVSSELKQAVAFDDDKAAERLAQKQILIYDRLETAREKLAIEISQAAKKQADEEIKASRKAAAAAEKDAAKKKKAAQKQFDAATKSARRFGTRLGSIVSGALVFNLLSSGLRNVTKYFGSALKSNDEFTASFAKLKGALLTAFQPIYEWVLPAILAIMDVATKAAQAIGHIFASMAGKSDSQMAKNAQALYEQANATEEVGEAAKKAQRQLAGFDEIQKLNSTTTEAKAENNNSEPDFSAFSTEEDQSKIEELVVWTSLAMLGLGVLLTFSGASIPLGIGLMAAGAIGLAESHQPIWDTVKKELEGPIGEVSAIIGGAFLALGAILAFSGANIPLGIALVAMGAVGIVAPVAANWNSIAETLRGPIGVITAIVSVGLLAIGAILAFSGVALPLGIALIAAGAAGLVADTVANWSSIKEPLTTALTSILAIISGAAIVIGVLLCFTGAGLGVGLALILSGIAGSVTAVSTQNNPVTRFVADMVNGIISLINLLIEGINNLFHIRFDGLKIGGVQIIPEINTKLLDIPKIPYLAQGAVLPPNKPFMAMLGDQRHGTNVEAPLSTIQEAVAAVMNEHFGGMMAGFEALLEENQRLRSVVEGIELGDSTIGQAANRYNQKMAIIKGGL